MLNHHQTVDERVEDIVEAAVKNDPRLLEKHPWSKIRKWALGVVFNVENLVSTRHACGSMVGISENGATKCLGCNKEIV